MLLLGLSVVIFYFFSLPYYFAGSMLVSLFMILLGNVFFSHKVSQIGVRLDLSFGLFLYHFPVMQILIATFPAFGRNSAALLSSSLTLSLVLAFASWTFIEKPAKNFVKKI
jgi:peptidoglycan/LPS O-acetylase OafA/YrhL